MNYGEQLRARSAAVRAQMSEKAKARGDAFVEGIKTMCDHCVDSGVDRLYLAPVGLASDLLPILGINPENYDEEYTHTQAYFTSYVVNRLKQEGLDFKVDGHGRCIVSW